MALIWVIILNFFVAKFRNLQIKLKKVSVSSLQLSEDETANNEFSQLNESQTNILDARKLLVDSLKLKFNLNIVNLKKDFIDGRQILLLTNKLKPNLDLIAKGDQIATDYERLKFALDQAEAQLGIKKIVTEDDISQVNPDFKSLIIYFYQFLERDIDEDIDNLIKNEHLIKRFIDKIDASSFIKNKRTEELKIEFINLKPIYEQVSGCLDESYLVRWNAIENEFLKHKELIRRKIENSLKCKLQLKDKKINKNSQLIESKLDEMNRRNVNLSEKIKTKSNSSIRLKMKSTQLVYCKLSNAQQYLNTIVERNSSIIYRLTLLISLSFLLFFILPLTLFKRVYFCRC